MSLAGIGKILDAAPDSRARKAAEVALLAAMGRHDLAWLWGKCQTRTDFGVARMYMKLAKCSAYDAAEDLGIGKD